MPAPADTSREATGAQASAPSPRPNAGCPLEIAWGVLRSNMAAQSHQAAAAVGRSGVDGIHVGTGLNKSASDYLLRYTAVITVCAFVIIHTTREGGSHLTNNATRGGRAAPARADTRTQPRPRDTPVTTRSRLRVGATVDLQLLTHDVGHESPELARGHRHVTARPYSIHKVIRLLCWPGSHDARPRFRLRAAATAGRGGSLMGVRHRCGRCAAVMFR